jgi:hypothetical protein
MRSREEKNGLLVMKSIEDYIPNDYALILAALILLADTLHLASAVIGNSKKGLVVIPSH